MKESPSKQSIPPTPTKIHPDKFIYGKIIEAMNSFLFEPSSTGSDSNYISNQVYSHFQSFWRALSFKDFKDFKNRCFSLISEKLRDNFDHDGSLYYLKVNQCQILYIITISTIIKS